MNAKIIRVSDYSDIFIKCVIAVTSLSLPHQSKHTSPVRIIPAEAL